MHWRQFYSKKIAPAIDSLFTTTSELERVDEVSIRVRDVDTIEGLPDVLPNSSVGEQAVLPERAQKGFSFYSRCELLSFTT